MEDRKNAGKKVGFAWPVTAKLMLLCSPLFLSLPHAWRIITLEELTEFRPENRVKNMLLYLKMEITFSTISMPIAIMADSTVGVTITFLCFLSVTWIPLLTCSLSTVESLFSEEMGDYIARFGITFVGFIVLASVLERTLFVTQMNVSAPSFRLYCFLCYYLSNIVQIVNSLMIFLPKLFYDSEKVQADYLSYIQLTYQCLLWVFMVSIYCLIIYLNRPAPIPTGGESMRIIACIYLAIYYSIKSILAKMRWTQVTYNNAFDALDRWYPLEVVNTMKKVFKLFIITMCLMYLCGLELILRGIWFHQDVGLARRPKPSFWTIFPMEMLLLLYVLALFPFIEFLVLPCLRKKCYFRVTDLRLLGVALIFYNLSYIATMALEWTMLSVQSSSPRRGAIMIRIYNSMIHPVTWSVAHSTLTTIGLFLPGRMSRMYLNQVSGLYTITLNSSVIEYTEQLNLQLGNSAVFFLRDATIARLTEMELQIKRVPKFHTDDTHLYVLNGLINSSKEYLTERRVKVTLKHTNGRLVSSVMSNNVTHILLNDGWFDIHLEIGNTTFLMKKIMNEHGVYSLMFYDSWSKTDAGYEFDTVSTGLELFQYWAHIQIFLLAVGMSVGYIPMIRYVYQHAPPDLLATCFSFQRVAVAVSTFLVWLVTNKYGFVPGPSTISTTLVLLFTVLFGFVTASDIFPEEDAEPVIENPQEIDSVSIRSGSLKFRSTMLIKPPENPNDDTIDGPQTNTTPK